MYEQYQDDPDSVSDSWRQFFADGNGTAPLPDGDGPSKPADCRASSSQCGRTDGARATCRRLLSRRQWLRPNLPPTRLRAGGEGSASDERKRARGTSERTPSPQDHSTPLKGAAAAIAANMERSLSVPTATSFRNIPAKLLEVNRNVINGYRTRSGLGKVSFTHFIGYAIVRAITDAVPAMRNSFTTGDDGKPRLVVNDTVNLGLAVDVDKGDGTRSLVVPVVKDASSMDFAEFLAAYEEIIRKVRDNKLDSRRLPGRQRHAHQPGDDRHRAERAPADAGPRRHRRRRQHRLPGRVRGRRPQEPVVARRLQGRHRHEHLRPPHHPGCRERAVPEASPRVAARRARLLRPDLHRARHALRGRQVAPRRQPDRPRRVDAAEADAGRHADPRVPRAWAPHRRPRSAALEGSR